VRLLMPTSEVLARARSAPGRAPPPARPCRSQRAASERRKAGVFQRSDDQEDCTAPSARDSATWYSSMMDPCAAPAARMRCARRPIQERPGKVSQSAPRSGSPRPLVRCGDGGGIERSRKVPRLARSRFPRLPRRGGFAAGSR
jgi:hypothetical protein